VIAEQSRHGLARQRGGQGRFAASRTAALGSGTGLVIY